MKKLFIATLVTMALSANAGTLSLQESVTVEVPQDELTASFYVEFTGSEYLELNKKAGDTLRKAFALGTEDVKVVSKGIQTTPVYGPNGKTNKYTIRAAVEVQSTAIGKASDVSNSLASFMAFENVRYSVSDSTLKRVRDEQAETVARRFMTKANTLAKALGYQSAEVEAVGLDVAAQNPIVQPMAKTMLRVSHLSQPTPDMALSAASGVESVTTTMNGTVSLK